MRPGRRQFAAKGKFWCQFVTSSTVNT